jgi:hypothetical protein
MLDDFAPNMSTYWKPGPSNGSNSNIISLMNLFGPADGSLGPSVRIWVTGAADNEIATALADGSDPEGKSIFGEFWPISTKNKHLESMMTLPPAKRPGRGGGSLPMASLLRGRIDPLGGRTCGSGQWHEKQRALIRYFPGPYYGCIGRREA